MMLINDNFLRVTKESEVHQVTKEREDPREIWETRFEHIKILLHNYQLQWLFQSYILGGQDPTIFLDGHTF